jgi:hypothetical protein
MVQAGTASEAPKGLGAPGDDSIVRLAVADGTASHDYFHSPILRAGRYATRNLADAIHYLAALHARYPGVIDLAAGRTATPGIGPFLIRAVDGFAIERTYLTKLVVAAGPQPSTPGQAECEAAVVGQRHALEMLAQSDREGCAAGAAIALILDWHAIREALDIAAARMSVNVPECKLPGDEDCADATALIAASPSIERALGFGAQQLLGQHRGLWDLLEARQLARGEY